MNAAAAIVIGGLASAPKEGIPTGGEIDRLRNSVPKAAIPAGDFRMKRLESTHILTRIVEAKRQRLEKTRLRVPEAVVKHFAVKAPAQPSFAEGLQNSRRVRVIAEVKKASPSKGVFRPDFSVKNLALAYSEAGRFCDIGRHRGRFLSRQPGMDCRDSKRVGTPRLA
jgi:hypothetical protein